MLSTLLLTLVKENTCQGKVAAIINYFHHQYEGIKVSYFIYNAIDKELLEYNEKYRFKQSDYTNPLVLSFLENRQFISDKIISYTDDSNFKQYSRKWGLDNYCVSFPVRNLGIFLVYNKDNNLFSYKPFLTEMASIIDGFINTEFLHKKNKQLEEQNAYFSQEANRNRLYNYEEQQKNYIEKFWVDETTSGKRFKRHLADLSQYDRNMLIIAEKGYGKEHLVRIIHQLRSSGLVELKEVDLLYINNIVQLNEVVKSQLDFIQKNRKETLFIKNIEQLNNRLFDHVINLVLQKKLENEQLKVILVVSYLFYRDKQDELHFWADDKIILTNRFTVRENKVLFLGKFIQDYLIKMKDLNGNLTEKVREYIVSDPRINEIRQLKFLVEFIYHQYGSFKLVTESDVNNILSQENWYQTNNLEWNVNLYERLLIRKSLVESDWSQRKSAEQLGIPRRTLNYKCQKYGLRKNGE